MTDDTTDDCSTCPRCRLRERLTAALVADRGDARQRLLDQYLDAVEALRAIDLADDDDLIQLVEAAVEEAVLTVDAIHLVADGDDDLEDDTADD